MNTYFINNIKIDIPDSMNEIKTCIVELADEKKNVISFINPEIFLGIEKNKEYIGYFERTRYNFVDGIGLLMAVNKGTKSTCYDSKSRFPGTDFFSYLDDNRKWKVFLYGASKENNVLACKNIGDKYKNVDIVGNIDGFCKMSDEEIVKEINKCKPDILIVCLGFPRQETWIQKNYDNLDVKLIFGNGGSIDFWSGNIKRAPQKMIDYNLEWLFRLFQDFNIRRIRRQISLVKFVCFMVLNKYKIKME